MNIDGDWNITMKTPLGSQEAKLRLSADGGTLTGNMESRLGSGDLTDGKVACDALRWKAALKFFSTIPTDVEFIAKVSGDTISGTMNLGRIGKAPFKGLRT